MIVLEGNEKEVREEYCKLLEKAKAGYKDMVYEFKYDLLGTFKIQDENLRVTFSVSKYFKDTYAIYQIFE